MTLNVTVPDAVYRQMAELAARQQVSVERIVAVFRGYFGATKLPNSRGRAIGGCVACHRNWLR